MLLPANFSFFSELLDKDNFLDAFNKFSKNKIHDSKDLYLTNKPLHDYIVINTNSEYYFYSDTETSNIATLSNKNVQGIAVIFLGFDEDGYPLFKWHDINKNHSLIYSRFIHQAMQHYYVFSYINNKDHFDINNSEIIKKWHAQAKYYRNFIIYKYSKTIDIDFATII